MCKSVYNLAFYREYLLLIKILTPLIFAVLVPVIKVKNNLFAKISVILAISISLISSIFLTISLYFHGTYSYFFGGWVAPWGIELKINYLSSFISLIILSISLLVAIYSLKNLEIEIPFKSIPRYYSLLLTLVFALLGITLTEDIFNLFVFIEISTIAACSLISIVNRRQNVEAAFKYLVLSSLGSGCILFAIALIYMVTGNLNMSYIGAEMVNAWELYPKNILMASSFLIVGFSVKSAIFPVHVWLLDAYSSAPSTSSALLSGTVTKIYAVAMIKILFTIFGGELLDSLAIQNIFLVLASLSIVFGSLFAISQADIKRMLAYSSVAQIGYVYLGIDLASQAGISGALLHILNHAIMKAGLFLIVGIIINKTGIRKISDFSGLGRKMPLVMICFSILALSMIGIPPFSGFFSKWYLALGAIEANESIYVLVILISSLLNAFYYLPIIISAFFDEKDDESIVSITKEIPKTMLSPVLILSFSSIFLGLYYTLPLDMIQKAVADLLS